MTVSLDIAKKLKEAGWEQETYFELSPKGHLWPKGEFKKFHTCAEEDAIPAPTLTELLEVMPDGVWLKKCPGPAKYLCGFTDIEGNDFLQASNKMDSLKNPADALGLLWIALKEKGVI